MTDKLDDLVSGVQKHIADKRAELTAVQTQLKALQSAHADLHQEVNKVQDKLAESRQAVEDSGKELSKRRKEANRIADSIIASGQAKRAQAEESIRRLAEESATKVMDADKRLKDIEALIAEREAEYNSLVNDVNAKNSEWAAVREKARKVADG